MSYLYSFGQFVLDPRKRTLSRADTPVSLTPKAFDVLTFLAQNPHRLVTKEELLQAVWGDTFVEEGNLTQYISHLRKALDDNSENARLIVTIARKGYQFAGEVVVAQANPATQVESQVSGTQRSRADTASTLEIPRLEAAARKSKSWQKSVIIASSIFLLALLGFTSWRHYRLTAS